MGKFVWAAIVSLLLVGGSTFADSLHGSIKYKDGSKDRGTASIKTSWNGQIGKNDGNGNYTLDFKGKVGKKVTVYVNGKKYTEIEVKGNTRLDIVIPD